jgi:hypothetical protein
MLLAHSLWEQTPQGEAADEAVFAAAVAQTMGSCSASSRASGPDCRPASGACSGQIADNAAGLYAVGGAGGRGGSVGSALAALTESR